MSSSEISVDRLGSLVAYNEREEAVPLADLWREQTAVLVFVRHFG